MEGLKRTVSTQLFTTCLECEQNAPNENRWPLCSCEENSPPEAEKQCLECYKAARDDRVPQCLCSTIIVRSPKLCQECYKSIVENRKANCLCENSTFKLKKTFRSQQAYFRTYFYYYYYYYFYTFFTDHFKRVYQSACSIFEKTTQSSPPMFNNNNNISSLPRLNFFPTAVETLLNPVSSSTHQQDRRTDPSSLDSDNFISSSAQPTPIMTRNNSSPPQNNVSFETQDVSLESSHPRNSFSLNSELDTVIEPSHPRNRFSLNSELDETMLYTDEESQSLLPSVLVRGMEASSPSTSSIRAAYNTIFQSPQHSLESAQPTSKLALQDTLPYMDDSKNWRDFYTRLTLQDTLPYMDDKQWRDFYTLLALQDTRPYMNDSKHRRDFYPQISALSHSYNSMSPPSYSTPLYST